jgi:hypothetical protein
MLRLRSVHDNVIETACYGPYDSQRDAHEAAMKFNLHDWLASIHEVKPTPVEGSVS